MKRTVKFIDANTCEDITEKVDPHFFLERLFRPFAEEQTSEIQSKWLYFISDGKRVKIGVSNDPIRRLKDLQTSNSSELVLLGIISGDFALEAKWHERFKDLQQRGEWFRLDGSLKQAIKEALTTDEVSDE